MLIPMISGSRNASALAPPIAIGAPSAGETRIAAMPV